MNIVKLSNLFKQLSTTVGLNGYRFGYASEIAVQTLTANDFPIMYLTPPDEEHNGSTATAKIQFILEDTLGYSQQTNDTRTRPEVWRDLQKYALRILCALEHFNEDCFTVITNGFSLEYNHRSGSHTTAFIVCKLTVGYRPDADAWTFDSSTINLETYDERDPANQ